MDEQRREDLVGESERRLQANQSLFRRFFIRCMNPGQDAVFFDLLSHLGDLVDANVVIHDTVFRQAASPEVAHDFADDFGVAKSHRLFFTRFQFLDAGCQIALLQFAMEGFQIGSLSHEHFVPLFARRAGCQTRFGLNKRIAHPAAFSRLHQEMGGAIDHQLNDVSRPATFQAFHRFFHLQPVARRSAQRTKRGASKKSKFLSVQFMLDVRGFRCPVRLSAYPGTEPESACEVLHFQKGAGESSGREW